MPRNSGASLIDLGDGVLCCEFHSKMNAIGDDIAAMLHAGLKRLGADFDAMVIANQAPNFSVGANCCFCWSPHRSRNGTTFTSRCANFKR